MSIQVDECIFKGSSSDTMVLGFMNEASNPACQTSTVENGIHTISATLDQCGMEIEESGGLLMFHNNLSVADRQSTFGLVMSIDVDVPVTCAYSTVYNTQVTDLNILETVHKIGALSSVGQFDFKMEMTNDQFTSELTEGLGFMYFYT